MKASSMLQRFGLLAGLMLGTMPQAFAQGTAAGTDITNTVTVSYEVNTVAQTDVTASVTFEVDRRVMFTVVADTGGLSVVPDGLDQVLEYTVTNNTNGTQDFALTPSQLTGDQFNALNLEVFVDRTAAEGGTTVGTFGADDVTFNRSFIDELAADASRKVFIRADIPNNRVNGDVAQIRLAANAHQSTDVNGNYVATAGTLAAGDSAETNTGSADSPTFVDTVHGDADADGAGTDDAAENNYHFDDDQYNVVTAALAVAKYSKVISDPFNGVSANAKAIPGAVIEYCLIVRNTGAQDADNVALSDQIPANTSYVASSLWTGSAGTNTTCTSEDGTNEADDDNAGAEVDGAPLTVSIPAGTVAGTNGIFRATFRVTIQN